MDNIHTYQHVKIHTPTLIHMCIHMCANINLFKNVVLIHAYVHAQACMHNTVRT